MSMYASASIERMKVFWVLLCWEEKREEEDGRGCDNR